MGFAADAGACTDVNECLAANGGCGTNATCTNTIGSRACACSPGFVGDGGSCLADPCLTNNGNCGARAACVSSPTATAQCACQSGYRFPLDGGTTCTPVWTPSQLPPFTGGAIGYLPARQRLTLVSPAFTSVWELNGSSWEAREVNQPIFRQPNQVEFRAITFDSLNGRFLAMGTAGDLWSFDGLRWAARGLGPFSYPRDLAFDEGRGQLIVLGSSGPTAIWDGTQWSTLSGPRPSSGGSMVYDAAGRRIVHFGDEGETWSWSGAGWTLLTVLNPPAGRDFPTLVFDRSRNTVVLFGGGSFGTRSGDTWELTGTTWTRRMPSPSPSPRHTVAAGWDPLSNDVVIAGGDIATETFTDEIWRWNGAWRRETQPPSIPLVGAAALTTDPTRNVLVLSGSSTWEWSAGAWAQRSTTGTPWVRTAFDTQNNVVVGWYQASSSTSGFAEWSGTTWTNRATTPGTRNSPCVGYDPMRARVVLLGGVNGAAFYSDTWTWSGTQWTARSPGTSPSARWACATVWDPSRQALLFIGGSEWVTLSGERGLSDVWAWSGTNWSSIALPIPRYALGAAYDSARQRVVLTSPNLESFTMESNRWLDLGVAPPIPPSASPNTSSLPVFVQAVSSAPVGGKLYAYGRTTIGTNGSFAFTYFLPQP